jgi:beta-glucanase (GH16 family)
MKPMRVGLVLLGAVLLAIPTVQAQTWTQTWADDFNGSGAPGGDWVQETGAGGWGNSELQYYRNVTGNVSQGGGSLTITARKENYGGAAYTSGRIKTQGRRNFGPGDAYPVKVWARLKGPMGQGLWPAFWMLGSNIGNPPWPACGEIDIMEHVNAANQVFGTIHWAGPAGEYWNYGAATPGQSSFSSFHNYGIEWTSSAITWKMDNVAVGSANIAGSINSTEEFHRSFFILLNLAVGGTWPGAPNSGTPFPSTFVIDKVGYERK